MAIKYSEDKVKYPIVETRFKLAKDKQKKNGRDKEKDKKERYKELRWGSGDTIHAMKDPRFNSTIECLPSYYRNPKKKNKSEF